MLNRGRKHSKVVQDFADPQYGFDPCPHGGGCLGRYHRKPYKLGIDLDSMTCFQKHGPVNMPTEAQNASHESAMPAMTCSGHNDVSPWPRG